MNRLILPFQLNNKELDKIESRLSEFKEFQYKDNNDWFNELAFCILTANSKAITALNIQNSLKNNEFITLQEDELSLIIKSHHHRFHNNKAKYICLARQYKNIKDIILSIDSKQEKREFLVKNIKGLGFKEASHFLRNVGYSDYAIIDRHIIKFLYKYKFIDYIPKNISKKEYLKIEDILKLFNIKLDKLDLMIWYFMTGKILK
jgi:N-glycosylase/DNA lyase